MHLIIESKLKIIFKDNKVKKKNVHNSYSTTMDSELFSYHYILWELELIKKWNGNRCAFNCNDRNQYRPYG